MSKFVILFLFVITLPIFAKAQVAVFNPAEFEKNEGVLLVWDYSASRDSVTANIAKIAQTAGKVWIIFYPGQAPVDTAQIRSYLYSRGVTAVNLFFLPAYTETLWIRDFGPMVLYGNFGQGSQRYIIDMGYNAYNRPKDDSIPLQIARRWGWPAASLNLQIEGGNLMFDGLKRGFTTKRVLQQNPGYSQGLIRNMLIDKFNQEDFVFLESLNNSGGGIWKHVDMFMKILDYETIMVSSYPSHLPDYAVIEENVRTLESLTNIFGKPYTIIRIPAPPKANGNWATTQNDEMRTYTNSLILNNTVIVPSYGLPSWDNQALKIYKSAMPGYKIILVDSQVLTPLGGAIHCITKEVPAPHLVRIVHQKVTGKQAYTPDMHIYTLCESSSPLIRSWLYYKKNQATSFTRVPIYLLCPQNIGIIEGLMPTDTVHYYIESVSVNATATYPLSAPAGYFTFWFGNAVGNNETIASKTEHTLKIFPQPNNGSFYMHSGEENQVQQLKIFDAAGKVVLHKLISSGEYIKSELMNGVYIVELQTGSRILRSKMLVSR